MHIDLTPQVVHMPFLYTSGHQTIVCRLDHHWHTTDFLPHVNGVFHSAEEPSYVAAACPKTTPRTVASAWKSGHLACWDDGTQKHLLMIVPGCASAK